MKKDLTMSAIDRQNILYNKVALDNIQEYIGVSWMYFNGEYRFTKAQVCDFYGIDISTLDRYLSSNEEELNSDLLIYPNPTNGNVIIQVHNPENKYVQISVFDVSGRKIYDKTQKADNTFKLDLSNFTKGMYLINVKIGDDIELNKKVILN